MFINKLKQFFNKYNLEYMNQYFKIKKLIK